MPVPTAPSRSRLKLSYSINQAVEALRTHDSPPSSWDFARFLLQHHEKYGGGLAGKLARQSGPEQSQTRSVEAWLEALYLLLDPAQVPELHTRVALLGLARLDPALSAYFDHYGLSAALRQELKENFENLLRLPGPAMPGYISDSVNRNAPDRLAIEREVDNLASVILYRRVEPPLSIGLFGDWGSGKSFFMMRLQRRVRQLAAQAVAEAQGTGEEGEWCSRVVQIEFNAWHFSDANLWASLVTRIYDALYAELNDEEVTDDERRQKLRKQIRMAEGAVHQAEIQQQAAAERVHAAERNLSRAREETDEKQNALRALIGDVDTLLGQNPRIKKKLDQAAGALGMPEAAASYETLEALHSDIRSFRSRTRAVVLSAVREPQLVLAATLLVLLPLFIVFLLHLLGPYLGEIGKIVGGISTFVLGLITWVSTQMRRGARLVRAVGEGLEKARSVRAQKIETDPAVAETHQALVLARSREEAAQGNLHQAQSELQRLQRELYDLRPDRQLFRLFSEHEAAGTYTKHLGIISLIRADLERMSELFAAWTREPRRPEDPLPLQRIILYIDDLDRCRPEQVVAVLEAVHLLLAFPLFVVVVGVDPRWLRHALAQHYPRTLAQNWPTQNRRAQHPHATPQDYLEKIFQIPYALRPVERDGYERLIGDLLGKLPKRRYTREASLSGEEEERNGTEETASVASGTDATEKNPSKRSSAAPKQLTFTEWEKRDIEQLWPLFSTPRTVKRFINTYRLLRAGLEESETAVFEGTEEAPGTYQTALLLLAVVTGATGEAAAFFARIDAWLDQAREPEQHYAWLYIIGALRQASDAGEDPLQDLLDMLERIVRGDAGARGFLRGCTPAQLRQWAERTARFSFSIRPQFG